MAEARRWGPFFHLAGFEPSARSALGRCANNEHEMKMALCLFQPGFLSVNAHHKDHTSAKIDPRRRDPASARDLTQAD
jgi:hypothetical protein